MIDRGCDTAKRSREKIENDSSGGCTGYGGSRNPVVCVKMACPTGIHVTEMGSELVNDTGQGGGGTGRVSYVPPPSFWVLDVNRRNMKSNMDT